MEGQNGEEAEGSHGVQAGVQAGVLAAILADVLPGLLTALLIDQGSALGEVTILKIRLSIICCSIQYY